MAYRSKKLLGRPGTKARSNKPKSVSVMPSKPKLNIESNDDGQIKTFDASTGKHRWLTIIRVK